MGLTLLDLIQEGNIGLISAAQNFNAADGASFAAYAGIAIRRRIYNALLQKTRLIRLPIGVNRILRASHRAADRLTQQLGRPPSIEEIAEAIEVPPERLLTLEPAWRPPVSFDAPLDADDGEGDARTLYDAVAAPNEPEGPSFPLEPSRVAELVDGLSERRRFIIQMHYGIGENRKPLSLQAIADQWGCTQQAVHKVKQKALSFLRERACLQESITTLGDGHGSHQPEGQDENPFADPAVKAKLREMRLRQRRPTGEVHRSVRLSRQLPSC